MSEVEITSNGIKQAIDDLLNENEMLQDKVYRLEDIIKEVRECIEEMLDNFYNDDFIKQRGKIKNILQILDKEKI